MSSPCRLRESSTPPGAEAPGPAHHRPSSIPGERRRRGGSAPFGGCLDEMDVRGAVAAAVEKPKPLRRSLRRGFLPDDQRRGCEPAARQGGRERALSEALAVGRVEKDEACGYVRRPEAGRVAVENEGLGLDAGFRDVGAHEGLRPCAVVDEGRPRRAAGKGFEAERAGAREEVEHCRAFGEALVGENVEEAFAHAVGGGPEMRPGVALAEARKLQTLQAAADDPHAFRSGLRSADASAITAGSGDLPASMSLLPTM